MADDNDSVNAIFLAALEFTSAEQRNDFLDRSCAGDAELRTQIDKLLRLHEVTGNSPAPRPDMQAADRISDKGLDPTHDSNRGSAGPRTDEQHMPPEQAAGKEIKTSADIYSLGAILYAMLTGHAPFEGSSQLEIIMRVIQEEPTKLRQIDKSIPRDLEVIQLRLGDKEATLFLQTGIGAEMKSNSPTRHWMLALGSVGLLLVSLVSGFGAYFGNRMAQGNEIGNMRPIQLHASTSTRGESVSMATGTIDGSIEGLFILDHVSGDLQCWALSPRTGAVRGIYRANVATDMGSQKAGEADYVMATGNFSFSGVDAGKQAPGQTVCYVADTKSGKVIGYGLFYDKQAIRRDASQTGLLKAICNGMVRGKSAALDK